MTNSITNRQMFFILVLTLTSYTSIDFAKIMAEAAGRSGWILVLAAGLVFGLVAVVITSLNNRFQGKVFVDYSQELVGKPFSRVITVYYLMYFILLGVFLNVRLVGFLTANFMPTTSKGVILAVAVGMFAMVAFKGITNVARLFELYGLAFVVSTIIICVVMLPQGMIYNILPLVNQNEIKLFPQALHRLPFPFDGIEILFIVPFSKNNRKAPLVSFLTLVFIGFFYVLILESTISILGINNTILYNDAFIEAIKVVNLPVIERTDLFYLTIGLTSLFSGMIIVFLAVLEVGCRLFPKVQRHIMTLFVAGVLYVLGMLGLGIQNMADVFDLFMPFLMLVSSMLIPTTLYIVSKAKDKRGGTP